MGARITRNVNKQVIVVNKKEDSTDRVDNASGGRDVCHFIFSSNFTYHITPFFAQVRARKGEKVSENVRN